MPETFCFNNAIISIRYSRAPNKRLLLYLSIYVALYCYQDGQSDSTYSIICFSDYIVQMSFGNNIALPSRDGTIMSSKSIILYRE